MFNKSSIHMSNVPKVYTPSPKREKKVTHAILAELFFQPKKTALNWNDP